VRAGPGRMQPQHLARPSEFLPVQVILSLQALIFLDQHVPVTVLWCDRSSSLACFGERPGLSVSPSRALVAPTWGPSCIGSGSRLRGTDGTQSVTRTPPPSGPAVVSCPERSLGFPVACGSGTQRYVPARQTGLSNTRHGSNSPARHVLAAASFVRPARERLAGDGAPGGRVASR